MDKIWNIEGGRRYLTSPANEINNLENGIYTVGIDQYGRWFLSKQADGYVFDYKIYGLETKFINRVVKTYTHQKGNLGILLNGIRGTGKTVSSKLIANAVSQPIILIREALDGIHHFVNSIPQDITIFIDEYEKVYGKSNDMLTIMDGASNSEYKRLFLLTTNNLYIEENLKERPSRIRYLKEFSDLEVSVVEEIIDDLLIHKDLKLECVKFIMTLSIITVDIIKEIINEVNLHNESPSEFGDIFNVRKISNKYKIFEIKEDGTKGLMFSNSNVYPAPEYKNDNIVGNWVTIDDVYIGKIHKLTSLNSFICDIVDSHHNSLRKVHLSFEKTYGTNYTYQYDGINYGYETHSPNEVLESGLELMKSIELSNAKHQIALEDIEKGFSKESKLEVSKAIDVTYSSRPLRETYDSTDEIGETFMDSGN